MDPLLVVMLCHIVRHHCRGGAACCGKGVVLDSARLVCLHSGFHKDVQMVIVAVFYHVWCRIKNSGNIKCHIIALQLIENDSQSFLAIAVHSMLTV